MKRSHFLCISGFLMMLTSRVQAMTGYGVSYVARTTGVTVPALFFASALRFAIGCGKKD